VRGPGFPVLMPPSVNVLARPKAGMTRWSNKSRTFRCERRERRWHKRLDRHCGRAEGCAWRQSAATTSSTNQTPYACGDGASGLRQFDRDAVQFGGAGECDFNIIDTLGTAKHVRDISGFLADVDF